MYIKDFLECIRYRVSEGSEYLWKCYGPNAYILDSMDTDSNGSRYQISAIFDTVSTVVYEIQALDYKNSVYFRWIRPEYIESIKEESISRNIDFSKVCDENEFTDLEVCEDIISKASAIISGVSYDQRIDIPLDLSEREAYKLMKLAHQNDMTLNKYVEKIMEEELGKLSK